MRGVWRVVIGGLLCVASTGRADAQRCSSEGAEPRQSQPTFFLPIELGQGAAWVGGVPAAYVASLRLDPAVGIGAQGQFRIGPAGVVDYFSPDVAFMGGGRVSYRVAHPVNLLGSGIFVHLAGEALWGTRNRRTLGGALVVDADRFAQLTLRVGRELHQHHTLFEISLGTDIALWASRPARRPPFHPTDRFAGFDGFFRRVAVRMSTEASWLCDTAATADRSAARTAVGEASRQPDVKSLDAVFRRRGIERLARTVEATLDGAQTDARQENEQVPELGDPGVQRRLVAALVFGLQVAMGESTGG